MSFFFLACFKVEFRKCQHFISQSVLLIVVAEAMDRIHRLGQHRPVQAIKLITEDSIESRIVQASGIPSQNRSQI